MTVERVRQFLQDLHATWPGGDVAAIAAFYHPDVVLLPPDLGEPIVGREAVAASYADFLAAANLEQFEITGLELYDFPTGTGSTCMAHLHFHISYELNGERYLEQGLEIYTVIDSGSGPLIVWRSQTVLDSRLAGRSEPRG